MLEPLKNKHSTTINVLEREWTIKEAIEYGVGMENRAIRSYTKIMRKTKNPGSKQFLKEIIDYKKKHKKIFEDALTKPDELVVYCQLPMNLVDFNVTDYLREVDLDRNSTYQDLLIFTSRAEQRSHDFYMFMATQLKGRDIGEVFACFARENLEHKLMLEKEYDSVILSEN
jgi:rubrerythrin